jgi:LysM repeat protein
VLFRLLFLLILAAALAAGGYYAVQELYVKPEQKLLADKQLPAPAPPPDPSLAEFQRCMEIKNKGSLPEARAAFERFLKEFPESKKREAALDAIGEINSATFFSMKPDETNTYVVAAGDSLSRISGRRKIPVELILHLNKMESDTLQIGQRVLAPMNDFRVVLQQKTRTVVLHNGQKFFRQYRAANWPGMNKNPPVFLPKATGKVSDKVSFVDGRPAKPTDPAYFGGNHILVVTIPGHSLYTQPEDPAANVNRPTGGGIGLPPALMSEIAILLPRGTPVTLD